MINKERLIEIVEQFDKKFIAVVGDLALDHYVLGHARFNPENPAQVILTAKKHDYIPGCAANVAANVSSLKSKVILYGLIGEDHYGDLLKEACKKRLVDLVVFQEGDTIIKQRPIELTRNGSLNRVDLGEENLFLISDEASQFLFEKITAQKYDAIILSDYNKRVFKTDLGQKIINWANSQGIITIVDPKPVNAHRFKRATLVRPNHEEAEKIVDSSYSDKKSLAIKLKKIMECEYVAITCGSEGIISYDGDFHYFPTKSKQVAEVIGAGDTVASVIALAMSCKASISDSCNLANYAAGIVVDKPYTATPSREELKQRILQDF